jgi:hypothetical protein
MMTCIQFQFCYRIQCRQTHTTSLPLSDLTNLLLLSQHTLKRTYTDIPRRISLPAVSIRIFVTYGKRLDSFFPPSSTLRYEET